MLFVVWDDCVLFFYEDNSGDSFDDGCNEKKQVFFSCQRDVPNVCVCVCVCVQTSGPRD